MMKKRRISVLVSEETYDKWEKIVARDKDESETRHYPAHTLKRLIDAESEINRAFGKRGKKVKKTQKPNVKKSSDLGWNYDLFEQDQL